MLCVCARARVCVCACVCVCVPPPVLCFMLCCCLSHVWLTVGCCCGCLLCVSLTHTHTHTHGRFDMVVDARTAAQAAAYSTYVMRVTAPPPSFPRTTSPFDASLDDAVGAASDSDGEPGIDHRDRTTTGGSEATTVGTQQSWNGGSGGGRGGGGGGGGGVGADRVTSAASWGEAFSASGGGDALVSVGGDTMGTSVAWLDAADDGWDEATVDWERVQATRERDPPPANAHVGTLGLHCDTPVAVSYNRHVRETAQRLQQSLLVGGPSEYVNVDLVGGLAAAVANVGPSGDGVHGSSSSGGWVGGDEASSHPHHNASSSSSSSSSRPPPGQSAGGLLQHGVLRTNCVDCLDRTNVAQFFVGVRLLGLQLHALGLVSSPRLDPSNTTVMALMELFEEMGDRIALQYGGSEAHKKVHTQHVEKAEQEKRRRSGQSKEVLTSIKRYVSNSFTDALKQVCVVRCV